MLRTTAKARCLLRLTTPPMVRSGAANRLCFNHWSLESSFVVCHTRRFSALTKTSVSIGVPVAEETAKPAPKSKKTRKRTKQKRPVVKNPEQVLSASSIKTPLEKENAERLFDEISPLIPLKTLQGIIKRLEKAAQKIQGHTTLVGRVDALLKKVKMPESTYSQLNDFLLGRPSEKFVPPMTSKEQFETHIELLQEARNMSAENPLLWRFHQRKKTKSTHKAALPSAEETVNVDQGIEHDSKSIHHSKSIKRRRREAQEFAVLLAERLPPEAYTELIEVFRIYVHDATDPDRPKLRILLSHLKRCAGSHLHLVASDVAAFFYVKFHAHDTSVKRRENQWNSARLACGESLLKIHEQVVVPPIDASPKNQSKETLLELDLLRTRPVDGVKVGRDRHKEMRKDGRPGKKQVHLRFDAIMLQDQWRPLKSPSKYTIFVDNLPIDMTELELTDLFTRCGPVKSVQIFNQRPELDPGPLTVKQRREIRKRQAKAMMQNRKGRWTRPRTPVYGMIAFSCQEGYDRAIDLPMRIFGMVVRKHPMRTIRISDFTKLYLEDIPKGMYNLDIEHKLSKLLHPEIYVCLDVGQHDYGEPLSCEIDFPTFEMAHHAYQKRHDLEIDGCTWNWMPTPADAEKYWKREYTFDT